MYLFTDIQTILVAAQRILIQQLNMSVSFFIE